jgi:hypothetical protein
MTASKLVLNAASGVGGAGEDVDALYGIRLWEGTTATRTITNDIDISGEGGMVWIKKTSSSDNHNLYDTVRGGTKLLESNSGTAEATSANGLTGFTSSGFTINGDGGVNADGSSYVGWTFRKAKKFFDVVQYTGTGSARTVSHNLGSVPGMILVKITSGTDDWVVYHRGMDSSAPEDYRMILNDNTVRANATRWNDTAPTSTEFSVDSDTSVNGNGSTYIAYLFAHNDGDGGFGENGDADIIKCGNYTGNSGSGSEPEINLGFEPQWILFRNTDTASNWFIYDNQRGWRNGLSKDFSLAADSNVGENAASGAAEAGFPTATGFDLKGCGLTAVNATGDNHIYVAIRKGSLNVPTDATKVFGLDTDATGGSSVVNFRPHLCDMAWFAKLDGHARNVQVADRVRGFNKTNTNSDDAYTSPTLITNANDSEFTSSNAISQTDTFIPTFPVVRGVSSGSNFCLWSFKRAPSYFDIVAYDGSSSAQNITHNLGVKPEMMWIKSRANANSWTVYHKQQGATKRAFLSGTQAFDTGSTIFNDTEPTATQFTVGTDSNTNYSGHTFMAYLFATADGVSKVGSFSHTNGGGDTNVDCGFSSGARLVMCKRASDTGSWYLFDSTRGIVSGNDPHLELNSSGAEVTGSDVIDPLNAGFTVTSGFLSSGTYIFWAIA